MDNELFKDAGKKAGEAPKEQPKVKAEGAEKTVEKTVADTQEAQRQAASPVSPEGAVAQDGGNASTTPVSNDDEDESGSKLPDELTMLKSRAKLMGVAFSNNIGLEALKEKIEEHKQKAVNAEKQVASQTQKNEEKAERTVAKGKKMNLRTFLQKEKMKLVRLRITNLDPKKKDLPGEILTTGNEFLGTVRKFIPFGEATDNGYHVPYCLYELMRDRKFLSIKTRKGPKGQTIVEQQMVREFALEILPPLTDEERARLSAAQLASGGVER